MVNRLATITALGRSYVPNKTISLSEEPVAVSRR